MANTLGLSQNLRNRLAAVARRVRVLRAVRGLSVFVLFLVLTAGVIFLLDFFTGMHLPAVLRQIFLVAWGLFGAGLLVIGVVLPVCLRLDPEALAAIIERKYPELAERLTTSVELTEHLGSVHGSQTLIALVVRETEEQAAHLNFFPAISPRSARILASAAGGVLALCIVPALIWQAQFSDLCGRFFFPWKSAPARASYVFEVTPGDKAVAVGDHLSFQVRIGPGARRVSLPETATLVMQGPGGETREPMGRHSPGLFAIKDYKVRNGFSYHVEIRAALSDDFTVTAVNRIQLAKDSPRISVILPPYAEYTENAELRPGPATGLVDVRALQHSGLRFDLAFTSPATAAYLEWNRTAANKSEVYPIRLAADRMSGRIQLPVVSDGTYRLILEAEHGIRTEDLKIGKVAAIADRPMIFQPGSVVVGAGDAPQTVTAYERIPIAARVRDDVGTGALELEYYRVGKDVSEKRVVLESIPLAGAGKLTATAGGQSDKWEWHLAGKVKEGDTVYYRLRASDSFPQEFGGPHYTYYPGRAWFAPNTERWLSFEVVKDNPDMQSRAIEQRHKRLQDKLEQIKRDILAEMRASDRLERESRAQEALNDVQNQALREVLKDNARIDRGLRDLVDRPVPADLIELDRLANDVADVQMKNAEKAFQKAGAEKASSANRRTEFTQGYQELEAALERLNSIKQKNDDIAKKQLAVQQIEKLAEREQALARKAADLAKQDPMKNPNLDKDLAELKKDEERLGEELRKLLEANPELRMPMPSMPPMAGMDAMKPMPGKDDTAPMAGMDGMRAPMPNLDAMKPMPAMEGMKPKDEPHPVPGNVMKPMPGNEAMKPMPGMDGAMPPMPGMDAMKPMSVMDGMMKPMPGMDDKKPMPGADGIKPMPGGDTNPMPAMEGMKAMPAGDMKPMPGTDGMMTPMSGMDGMKPMPGMDGMMMPKNGDMKPMPGVGGTKPMDGMPGTLPPMPAMDGMRPAPGMSGMMAPMGATPAPMPGMPGPSGMGMAGMQPGANPGMSLQQADKNIERGIGELKNAQPGNAQNQFEQAAKNLRDAAEQLRKQADKPDNGAPAPQQAGMVQPNGDPNAKGRGPGDEPPNGTDIVADRRQYAGKNWGDLPGELQARIISEAKTIYGDEYARMIQRYFQQLGERKVK